MARGTIATVGATNVSDNGYHYTKTEDGWRLTHHLIAEEKYGVKINGEYTVRFVDGDRTNLDPSNIMLLAKGKSSLKRRRAILEARLADIKEELKDIEKELNSST